MKKYCFILFVLITQYTQAFTGKIQFLNYTNDSISGYLVQPKNQFYFDTLKTKVKFIPNGFELTYDIEKPVIAYMSISGINYGPLYLGNGTLKTQMFTTYNYSLTNSGSYNQYHFFFEGQNVVENKTMHQLNEMLKDYYAFTFKIEEESRDSIFISKEKYFAKIDSVSNAMKSVLNTLKDNVLIKNTYSTFIANYSSCYKLSYLTYKKFYDRNYNWKVEGKKEIETFNNLPVMSTNANYYFGLQCMEYLYDTSAYFQWNNATSVSGYEYSETAVDDVYDEVENEEYLEDEPVNPDWYIESYNKRLSNIRNLKNKKQEEVMVAKALEEIISTYYANYFYMTTAEAKIAYEESFDKALNDFYDVYKNKEVYQVLSEKLRAEKDAALNPVTEDYYTDSDYVVDTAAYEETSGYFPNLPLFDAAGKEFQLPIQDKKKFVVIKMLSYLEEKDFVYLEFLEKKFKKVSFYYVFDSVSEAEIIKKYKLKGKALNVGYYNEQWQSFFVDQYYSCFKINSDYTFESGTETDLKFMFE